MIHLSLGYSDLALTVLILFVTVLALNYGKVLVLTILPCHDENPFHIYCEILPEMTHRIYCIDTDHCEGMHYSLFEP